MINLETLDNEIFSALNFISSDKNKDAQDLIKSILNNKSYIGLINEGHWQFIGDIYLACGEFEAAKDAYTKSNNLAALAFVLILTGDVVEANKIITNLTSSPVKAWCVFLTEINSGERVNKYPGYLLIRHFLEMTVYYLLLAKNHNLIQLTLKHLNKLLNINFDSEKFIGYAYFNFGDLDQALVFLNNSLKRNQMDGEVYFMLGKLYYSKDDYKGALDMLENAEILLPEHVPTKDLIDKVKNKVKV